MTNSLHELAFKFKKKTTRTTGSETLNTNKLHVFNSPNSYQIKDFSFLGSNLGHQICTLLLDSVNKSSVTMDN